MKKQMTKTLFVVLAITSMFLVGCGGKENVTNTNTETGTETIVAEVETSTQEENDSQEVIAEIEAPTPTEEPTPTPETIEEPTPTPTETPTPEPVHEHSYTETIIEKCLHMMSGTKRYTCSCGYSYEEEFFHESDGNRVMVVEPDCTSEGISAEHCIYCGERLYPELASPAIGHIPGNTWLYFPDTGGYYFTCVACNALCPSTTPPPEGAEIHENTPIDSNTLQPVN